MTRVVVVLSAVLLLGAASVSAQMHELGRWNRGRLYGDDRAQLRQERREQLRNDLRQQREDRRQAMRDRLERRREQLRYRQEFRREMHEFRHYGRAN